MFSSDDADAYKADRGVRMKRNSVEKIIANRQKNKTASVVDPTLSALLVDTNK